MELDELFEAQDLAAETKICRDESAMDCSVFKFKEGEYLELGDGRILISGPCKGPTEHLELSLQTEQLSKLFEVWIAMEDRHQFLSSGQIVFVFPGAGILVGFEVVADFHLDLRHYLLLRRDDLNTEALAPWSKKLATPHL